MPDESDKCPQCGSKFNPIGIKRDRRQHKLSGTYQRKYCSRSCASKFARSGERMNLSQRAKELHAKGLFGFGHLAREQERKALANIGPEFDFVYWANGMCDAIGIRNKQIYLIEFKLGKTQRQKRLTPAQARTKELLGDNYLVRS